MSTAAAACPKCGAPSRETAKPQQKKSKFGTFLKVLGGILLAILSICFIAGITQSSQQGNSAATLNEPSAAAEQASPKPTYSPKSVDSANSLASNLTMQQGNAVRSAKQYLGMKGFSRNGLIHQLSADVGEGFSRDDATVAVDSLNVDWNQEAVRAAKQYLDMSGFSCKGLIRQLSSSAGEGFTVSEATFGAKQAGAC